MTTTTNNIDYSGIWMHRVDTMPFPVVNVDAGEQFGALFIKMKKIPLNKIPLFLLFSIDRTASMQYRKLDYVKETFKHMMRYLASLDITVYITVHAFCNLVDVIVDKLLVNLDTIDDIISKIDLLVADGTTDIGNALNKGNLAIGNYNIVYPEHNSAHIFMTDGEPTIGIRNDVCLCKCIDDRFTHIFIGYGLDHNATLLRKMSNVNKADYLFVDNIENTGLVYAEIIHRLLYPAASDVVIEITDGEIYDWQTNQWTNIINEPTLVSETERFYQIKTTDPELVKATITGKNPGSADMILLDETTVIPDLIESETGELVEPNDLTKYIFRQHVQELLFEARSVIDNKSNFKKKLRSTFRKMRKYMREHASDDNNIIQLLCDDISLTYRTFNTEHGAMFAIARSSSQGRQQTYNVRSTSASATVDYDDATVFMTPSCPPRIARTNTVSHNDSNDIINANSHGHGDSDSEDDETIPPPTCAPQLRRIYTTIDSDNSDDEYLPEDELRNYIPTETDTTCYATPSILNTMRTMTQSS